MSAEDELQRVHSILGRATEDEAPHDAAWRVKAENERLRGALRDANRRARRALGGDYHYKQTLKVICRKTSEAAETLTNSEEASRE